VSALTYDSEHFSWWVGPCHDFSDGTLPWTIRVDPLQRVRFVQKKAPTTAAEEVRVPSSGALDCVSATQSASLAHEDAADTTASSSV